MCGGCQEDEGKWSGGLRFWQMSNAEAMEAAFEGLRER